MHLLNEDRRGSTLETIISRMKFASSVEFSCDDNKIESYQNIRFICISATIPNIIDVAEWVKTEKTAVKSFELNDEYRPVKLEKIVLGYPCPNDMASFRFDVTLNYKLAAVIRQYSKDKPTMIFCNSRKSIELAAKVLETALKVEFTKQEFKKFEEISMQ